MVASRYPSKRDRWLVALIWASAALAVFGGIAQWDAGAPLVLRGPILVFLVASAGFMLWVLYGTEYVLGEEALWVRSAPLRYRVPLGEIDSVTPSRDPRSSPATSLDRLLIRWSPRERSLLVSPEAKHEFLRELSQRCPQLVLCEDRLVRK